MNAQLRDRVYAVIEKAFQINPAALDPDRDFREQVSLDSMQFVALSAAIEKELNIELPFAVMEVRTVTEFLRVVDEAMSP
jgi:acyl carrier protein